jgi:hypothetical protein
VKNCSVPGFPKNSEGSSGEEKMAALGTSADYYNLYILVCSADNAGSGMTHLPFKDIHLLGAPYVRLFVRRRS